MAPMSPRLLRPKASGANLDPRSVGPLHCWFDASDSSTIFDANTGGSLPAAGGAIGRINDKSGNGRNATQGTANNRPTYQLGVQGGRSVMRFDGSNDALDTASFPTSAGLTVFCVCKASNWSSPGTYRGFFAHAYAGDSGGGFVGSLALATFGDWLAGDLICLGNGFTSGNAPRAIGPSSSGSNFRVVSCVLGSGAARASINGVRTSTRVETTGSVPSASGTARIGRSGVATEHWDGDICEVLYYSESLSSQAISAITNYLNYKWAVY
jgi:hypothetical protein